MSSFIGALLLLSVVFDSNLDEGIFELTIVLSLVILAVAGVLEMVGLI